jgi:DNA repair photolyase
VKTGGESETRKRLATAARRGELVALGTATDPYQPAEAASRVTRRLLEMAADLRGLRLAITTKGPLVLRDLDLLRRLHARGTLSVAISLVSPDAGLLRRVEPRAPPPGVRIEVLRRLAAERAYAGRSHLRGAYLERLNAMVERARSRHGLKGDPFGRCGKPGAPRQIALWG